MKTENETEKTEAVRSRVSKALLDSIDIILAHDDSGRSRSQFIRDALVEHVKKCEANLADQLSDTRERNAVGPVIGGKKAKSPAHGPRREQT